MHKKVKRGMMMGCITSVLLMIAVVFLFTITCGLLMRGCMNNGDAVAEAAALASSGNVAEDERPMETVWVNGAKDAKALVVRVPLKGVITSRRRPCGLFDRDEDASAAAALARVRAATRDAKVRGLYLELDTPGGSVTASDELHHALLSFKAAGTNRFVLVHMGGICASGGFYAAMAADCVMARPTTLTGSIGVIVKGFNAAALAQKAGVRSVTIASGENKAMLDPLEPVNPEHVAILKRPVEELHARFVEIVAKGRKMSSETVKPLADGRVFSAADAQRYGFVDGIGYAEDARARLEKLAGEPVKIVRYKDKRSFMQMLDASVLSGSAGDFVRDAASAAAEVAAPGVEFMMH